ncbi:1-acyl-sn-glycerol-3-phosphate acyltransferase [Desulfosalsimonas propionicica]|uniref:1-acyl-sn-glycerol-3-phosphate acyltransferase n=1 Tax=Desulfosalsimonas propionicica TaxID=332175 RepID=A0A7W0CBD8_9BACT|nr:lysophospholipid acyltransferase family protein [Desulfosalsimonas propionicica]MBA2882615.1 1-acyl-sn-glycerol-3-phosphate acyltransferase [Desulfosalsimonas propionicica]
MKNRLIAIAWFSFVGITSVIFFLAALVIKVATVAFDRRLVILQQFTCFWGALYTWIIPAWKIRIEGRQHIDSKKARVVVSNHQSLLDILVLFNLFCHFKFVSKSEIFKVPLIGWNMRFNRYIELKRGDKRSIARMMKDCKKALDEGSSVLIFPEGTRSPDGNIRNFKPGAFILATEHQAPIQPIVISGTNKALPKHSINFHGKCDIRVRVMPEIAYEEFAGLSPEETAQMVREKIIHELDDIEKQQTADGS